MNILDLFRPGRSPGRPERRPISGTQPGQELEIQRHRGRRAAGQVPMRSRARPKRAKSSTAKRTDRRTAKRTLRRR